MYSTDPVCTAHSPFLVSHAVWCVPLVLCNCGDFAIVDCSVLVTRARSGPDDNTLLGFDSAPSLNSPPLCCSVLGISERMAGISRLSIVRCWSRVLDLDRMTIRCSASTRLLR